MPIVKCDRCNGTGSVELNEDLTLMDLLRPFLSLKIKDSASIPRLKPLDYPEVKDNAEAFGEVVARIHGVE